MKPFLGIDLTENKHNEQIIAGNTTFWRWITGEKASGSTSPATSCLPLPNA